MKLLLHACCAPCSVYTVKALREEGIEPTMFWYNPNIHPFKEYEQRQECFKEYTKMMELETVFIDEYGLDEFCKNVVNSIDTRCVDYC